VKVITNNILKGGRRLRKKEKRGKDIKLHIYEREGKKPLMFIGEVRKREKR